MVWMQERNEKWENNLRSTCVSSCLMWERINIYSIEIKLNILIHIQYSSAEKALNIHQRTWREKQDLIHKVACEILCSDQLTLN